MIRGSSIAQLQVHKGYNMAWEEGHFWTAEVSLAPGTQLEFKVRFWLLWLGVPWCCIV